MVNHVDVVERVKAELVQRGFLLTGPDGAFEITKRVAWALRGEGAGLLDKPAGNNSHGYATDIICYPDGQIYDVLVSGGDINGPSWQDAGKVDASRWRAATDPDGGATGGGTTGGDTQGGKSMMDLAFEGFTKLDVLEKRLNARIDAAVAKSDSQYNTLTAQISAVAGDLKKSIAKYLPLLNKLVKMGGK